MSVDRHIDHSSPMHQFVIGRLNDWQLGGLDISFSKAAAFMFAAVTVATLFLILTTSRRALVPGRWQSVAELWYEFIADMIKETIGAEGRKYFPFVFSLFSFIVMCNLLGMLPYSYTVTAHIAVTITLALSVFLLTVPLVMLFLVVPIEILSYFMRPISHSVRLFANMTAGHTMLKVFGSFVVQMGVFGVLPFALIVALTGLEVAIAVLQAYVFTILTCLYLNDAIHLEH